MDLNYLSKKIEEINIPISTIADKMGISRTTFYKKLNGERDFQVSEIESICDILRLTNDEKKHIFFADKVDKNDNISRKEHN